MGRPIVRILQLWLRRPSTDDSSRAPSTSKWVIAAAYVGFPLVSLFVVLLALRITSIDQITEVPLLNYDDGDTLLILPMVKDAVERGNHWHNERMGAPGEFQLYDFPVIDHLHFACLWLIGQLTGSYVSAFNLYFLLGYPLTTLTTLAVFRWLGCSILPAGVGGLLYSFLYYHAWRGQAHYFLSAYWVIPLSMFVVLQVCRGEPPFTERRDGQLCWAFLRRASLGTLVIVLFSALGGAYYAFFTCAFLGFACVYGSIAVGSRKPAIVGALLIGMVWATGVAAHAPTMLFQASHGRNPHPIKRLPLEAELYGLKISHLFMPPVDHQSRSIGEFAASFHKDGRPWPPENRIAAVGFIASAGIIGVGAMFLLPIARRWPYGPVGSIVVFAILFATTGGLGTLFSFFVTSQIRAYTRISVFLGFLGLFATLRALDYWLPASPLLRWLVFPALAVLGILDQTPRPWFRPEIAAGREAIAAQYVSDREFFSQVEEVVPGGMVFVLPNLPYPESQPPHRMSSGYRFAAGYLHTRTVLWSFGAMREREIAHWQAEVAAEPIPRMTQRLIASGFDAVCVDLSGYTEVDGRKLLQELSVLCGPPCARQTDGSRVLFDLRSLRTQNSNLR